MTDTAALPTKRPALGDIAEGATVYVWPSTNGRSRKPDARPAPAKLAKASRVWMTIECITDDDWPREWRMRRDTQDEGNRMHPQQNARFVTPEQLAYDDAVAAARRTILEHGLIIDFGTRWDSDAGRVRLAQLLRSAND